MGDRICILKNGRVARCDTPKNLKREFGAGFKVKMVSDKAKHQQYLKHVQNDVKMMFEKKVMDALVVLEDN